MFERFTDRARHVVVFAQEEARLLNHNYIGTEHILLGLMHDGEGVAAKVLESLKISREAVRTQVSEIVGQAGSAPSGHIPFTPRAKKVLELSMREAIQLGHNYIGTEHILLGLIREGEGVAATVLVSLGVDHDRAREHVMATLSGYQHDPADLPSPEQDAARIAQAVTATRGLAAPSPATHCSFCGRDLFEVDRYAASAAVAICADCVALAKQAIEHAASAQEPVWGRVDLPPRVFGPEPSDPGAVSAITHAFTTLFSSSATPEERIAVLEDGVQLAPVLAEARDRHPSVEAVGVRVERIRLLDEHHARVRFVIVVGQGGFTFDGEAIHRDGRWRVSRESFCRVLALGGVPCPPRAD